MAFLKKKQYAGEDEDGDKRGRVDGHDGEGASKKQKGGSEAGALPPMLASSGMSVGENDGGEFSHKKKWGGEATAGEPQKKVANEALAKWVQQEKEGAERDERRKRVVNRARLLGFRYLDRNELLVDREPKVVDEDEKDDCSCAGRGGNCSDDRCENRSALVECFPDKCSVENCRNQRFQKREWVDFSLVKRGRMGYGVMAEQPLKRGQFVMEYVGEIIDEEEKNNRLQEVGVRHHYTMLLGSGEFIDPSRAGNFGRFLNHSCDPNCETQKWNVLGEERMGFFAKRDIAQGEDLTFNYQFERSGKTAQRCLCGSANCVGWIGLKKEKSGVIEDDEDDDSSIHEQAFDESAPDDPLGLGQDGNTVRPHAELSKKLLERIKQLDPSEFLITADLIGPLMAAARRDCKRDSLAVRLRVFLPRNVRRVFAMFYRVMDPDVSCDVVAQELNNHRPFAARSSGMHSAWFSSSADKKAAVEQLIASASSESAVVAPTE